MGSSTVNAFVNLAAKPVREWLKKVIDLDIEIE